MMELETTTTVTEGTDDGSWSSGRKSTTFSGLFNGNQRIHYDGEDILVADRLSILLRKLILQTQIQLALYLDQMLTNSTKCS